MRVTLNVDFVGLCLYVKSRRGRDKVAVLMPDCRKGHSSALHSDGTVGKHHVGFLKFDMAHLDTAIDGLPAETTGAEFVYRFDREELTFEPDDRQGLGPIAIHCPDLTKLAPVLEPIEGVIDGAPPPLLFRTILMSGELDSIADRAMWSFPGWLRRDQREFREQYAGFVTWRREIDLREERLLLRLRKLDAPDSTVVIPLKPIERAGGEPTIELTISNLCADNPLEWDTLAPRGVSGPDVDFKWLYRLLKARDDEGKLLLARSLLPVPGVAISARRLESIESDCAPGQLTYNF